MPEVKGYTCDGACGAATMVEKTTDSVTRQGWFITYTPDGYPTLYTCSPTCLVRAVEIVGGQQLTIGANGRG